MAQSVNEQAGAARATELEHLLARLREEHVELLGTLGRLEEAADCAERNPNVRAAVMEMKQMRSVLLSFMERLEEHAQVEEEDLIPLVDVYYHRKRIPTMTSSIWVMEKDHELAIVYLSTCLQRMEEFDPDLRPGIAWEAIHCLLQGCSLLKEHFAIEEKMLFPLVEELLTDMDYLFS
jgi:iron-sulfur cluster repair protein YtfE (RIC family)